MESTKWNPWHGCTKISVGCTNCYMFAADERYGKQSAVLTKNSTFDAPLKLDRFKNYKMSDCQRVYTCITSDFFHEGADKWRPDAWSIMKRRPGLEFFIFTKRTNRILECLPEDWGDGYENVIIGASCENQEMVEERLFALMAVPLKHRAVVCEPLLEQVDLSNWLSSDKFEEVMVGGESGERARLCRYEWVCKIREQCKRYGVDFMFHQTGSRFEKDGRTYKIFDRSVQANQALLARLNTGKFV